MAKKLHNTKVKKVDFVDEGANPDADIMLLKRKEAEDTGASSETEDIKGVGIIKRLIDFCKSAGINTEQVQKDNAFSFSEKINEVKYRKIADEIWDTCYALQSSLCSILYDDELDSIEVATSMKESLEEFMTVVSDCISKWSAGKASNVVKKSDEVTEADVDIMKSAVSRLNENIEKAKAPTQGPTENNENPKGEVEMKVDKSKMTPSEKAFLEDLEKRYGITDGTTVQQPESGTDGAAPEVAKSLASAPAVTQTTETGADDIYKGLHPAVKAELEALNKFKADVEDRELAQIAEKYTIIGKKKEELVPLFKSLKAAGGTAYNDMIAILDQTVDTVEKSGAFSEVGKCGHGAYAVGSAEEKINSIAKSYIAKDPILKYSDAVAKAWEDNPDLLSQYDEEAGF